MVVIGWKKSGNIIAKDDSRLAIHLSQVMEPKPWHYINHLENGIKIIERLKVVYRGHASYAKVRAARELGRIKIRKSESIINFRARFNDLIRQVKAAGGHRAKNKLINLYIQGVNN